MMPGIRRLITCAAVTGLLAAGAVAATIGVAHANLATFCNGTSTAFACSMTSTIAAPTGGMSVSVTDQTGSEQVTVSWAANAISCTDSSIGTLSEPAGGQTGATPLTVPLPLPVTDDGTCNVTVSVGLSSTQANGSSFTPTPFTAELNYTPAASPTATATATPTPTSTSTSSAPAVHPIKGFDGKCVDDNQNSSANRAKIQIWTCGSTYQAENWTFDSSNGEFKHNGKCMNDQGNGGNRSKVILYTCNGASNEKWNELANGEIRLQSHGGKYCLDDPRSSTTNGTQLIVYTCKDSANQKWSLP